MKIKRLFDLCVLILLFPLLPLLAIIYAIIYFFISRDVFFKQLRPGYQGKLFTMIKFKTMFDAHDDTGKLLPDEERLTKVGAFLRKTSLDELPELWNVLKGDMSLVGPRPLLPQYMPLYSKEQARRHDVKPGITGWAQINGRNAINWDDKFKLDVWYVDNQSFWLDIKILLLTVRKVISFSDISHQGSVTMPEFKGSSNE